MAAAHEDYGAFLILYFIGKSILLVSVGHWFLTAIGFVVGFLTNDWFDEL